MSKALGMRCVWGLCGVLTGVVAVATVARAEVSTDISGSVLVFPKVVWDGAINNGVPARDTVIQISNTSNNLVHAKCFFVNADEVNGQPLWQVTDFDIWLTRQQPTHFVVSQGRPVNPADNFPGGQDGSGLDPGAIPPVPPGFQGELKCVQVDTGGNPYGGNNLKGEALIRAANGDVSKHNAIAILANPDLASDFPPNELLLNNSPLNDGEYNSCPNTLMLDHFLDGAVNSVIADNNPIWCDLDPADPADTPQCPIRTYLTLVPCSQDFENQLPGRVTVQFAIVNELEQVFSASTTVDCWLTTRLADIDAPTGRCSEDSTVSCIRDEQCISTSNGFCEKNSVFSLGTTGSPSAFTRITPVDLDGGVIGVAEEVYFNSNTPVGGAQVSRGATAAWDLQHTGNRYDETLNLPGGPVVDVIRIPESF